MTIVITGVAGFIGFHVCQDLLNTGQEVLGIDNLNESYDVSLKQARLEILSGYSGFRFMWCDITDWKTLKEIYDSCGAVSFVIHLAAQAGVRLAADHFQTYLDTNIQGFFNILELVRKSLPIPQVIYASSSAVYGANTKYPSAIEDRVDDQVSLYALTKRINELTASFYARFYTLQITGLRFFTVYGPWGRPDMAIFLFTKAILEGRRVGLFNKGDLKRDFTYIDDIVRGIRLIMEHSPNKQQAPGFHKLYNLGSQQSQPLKDVIGHLEHVLQRKAHIELLPMQAGDVKQSCADMSATQQDLNFTTKTSLEEGITNFVKWYQNYYRIA